MAFGIRASDGAVGAPAFSFANDTDCGLYRIGANNIGVAIGGAKVVDYSATGVAVTGTFSASGASSLGVVNQAGVVVDANGNVTIGGGTAGVGTKQMATTGTQGFPAIPRCAGAPTGVPAIVDTYSGVVPLVVDSTNTRLYAYVGGAWRYATLT